MNSETKMNPVLRLIVLFWFLALTLVFEKRVTASRMRGEIFKPESNTSIMDHIHKKQAVEISKELQEKFAKAGAGIGVAGEGMEVASESESEQSLLSRQVITKNTMPLLSSAAELPSAAGYVADITEELTVRRLTDEIDYSGPSTHPPPKEH